MNNCAFFRNNTWNIVERKVNLNTFTISYSRKGGFRTKDHAEQVFQDAEAQYRNDLERIKKLAHISYTFSEYVDFWLKNIFLHTASRGILYIGTWTVEQIIKPNIKFDILLNYVTADYVNDIIHRCIPLCESSGMLSIRYLKKILISAYNQRLITSPVWEELITVKCPRSKIKLLNRNELAKLLQEASKREGCYFEILLALFAGLRHGEILALKYSDFDPANQTLTVNKQYTTNYCMSEGNDQFKFADLKTEKQPKADSSRVLKLPGFFFEELEKKKAFNSVIINRKKQKGCQDLDEEYVAISPSGKRKSDGTLSSALRRCCYYANIPLISFHTLRHQFATMLLEMGIPLEQISHLLGHKSTMTTFNYYCGLMDEDDKIQDCFDGFMPVPECGEAMPWL